MEKETREERGKDTRDDGVPTVEPDSVPASFCLNFLLRVEQEGREGKG